MRKSLIIRGAVLPAALISALACSSGSSDDNLAGTTPGNPQNPPVMPTTGSDPEKGVFESAHPSGVSATRGSDGSFETPTAGGGVDNGGVADGPIATPGVPAPAPGTPPPVANPTTPGQTPTPTGTTSPEPPVSPDEGGEVDRAIEEADVIKRDGDRLYALSAIGGLTVVDISNPDALKLLGRFRATATPFEMYVRDETVFVLYNGYGEYEFDDATETYTYYQTSYVMALDVSDPETITEQQRFEIPGYIADSRLVGDALYVVAYDDAYCYRCGEKPQTHVMSLNVADPTEISKVDEIDFDDRQDGYSWGRSLSGNNERLYVAGPRYGNGVQPEGSVIQVIDITDASGDMQEGDSLEVAGQINSRWQMDEHEGVLRVVSQPLSWAAETVPTVETFTIESSAELNPLGSVTLALPESETLQAVRFDGPRGYAITFRQTDPLFTIDLSDPANPTQAGELQMPGWVYYMEPRGDRLIGLGYDQGNAEGALTVSLFDVSDLAAPSMLKRVNFGGDWGNFAEDQNRIHKSFQVLDADELVLVPFSGYEYDDATCNGYGAYKSGVQLINWADDDLTLAGMAPSQGQARRAFLHQDRLLTMSDERLESFDISDRDEPESKSKVDLAQIVNQLEVAGDSVVRIGTSYWGNNQGLEVSVSSLDDLVSYQPGVTVELDDINAYTCDSNSYLQSITSSGDRVFFQYSRYNYNETSKSDQTRVKVLDVADPAHPEEVGDADLGFTPQSAYSYVPGMVNNGTDRLAIGSSIVFTNHTIEYNELGFIVKNESAFEIVDFSDPNDPQRKSVAMPKSLGSTGLLKSGDVLATSHFEVSPTNADAVRFFLDRVDLSDAGDPVVRGSVNIPGSLLAYDDENKRALTIDYQYVNFESISPKQCYEEEYGTFLTNNSNNLDWEGARGPCTAMRFKLNLVDVSDETAQIVDSYDVDKGVYINAAAVGDDRVFLGTAMSQGYGVGVDIAEPTPSLPPMSSAGGVSYIGYGYYSGNVDTAKLLVASGLGGESLTVAPVELDTTEGYYFSSILAKGKKAVIATGWQGQMAVVDATSAEEPEVADSIELAGYVSDLDLVGNTAVVALGQSGVQTLSLGE